MSILYFQYSRVYEVIARMPRPKQDLARIARMGVIADEPVVARWDFPGQGTVS